MRKTLDTTKEYGVVKRTVKNLKSGNCKIVERIFERPLCRANLDYTIMTIVCPHSVMSPGAAILPIAKSVFGIHDPIGLSYLLQLRVGLSKLNFHKFKHNFRAGYSESTVPNECWH